MREQETKDLGPGRPREFDEGEVLAQITRLFWDKGYDGTGLSDIMGATGLKKGSLYAAFGNKKSMYHKAILYYEQDVVKMACQMLRGQNPASNRLYDFLNSPIIAVYENRDYRGCFLCNAAGDQISSDPETRKLLGQSFDRLERALCDLVSDLRPDLGQNSQISMAQTLLIIYSGLRVQARAGVARTRLENVRDQGIRLMDH